MLSLLYLMIESDNLLSAAKNKNNNHYKNKLMLTAYDENLLNRFLENFSEQDLIRLNNIINTLNEKQAKI
ncbi:MAG: hypothetical protein GYA50_07830 [Eubacteriaceae bacterium]|nr:hypothetical protein [Eubacteriaceae bacterium]